MSYIDIPVEMEYEKTRGKMYKYLPRALSAF